jgi:hypothetical protein
MQLTWGPRLTRTLSYAETLEATMTDVTAYSTIPDTSPRHQRKRQARMTTAEAMKLACSISESANGS